MSVAVLLCEFIWNVGKPLLFTSHLTSLLSQKVESREGEVKVAEKRTREEFSAQIEELKQECKQIPKLNSIISEQKRWLLWSSVKKKHEKKMYIYKCD